MTLFSSSLRRSIAVCLVATLVITACGDGGDRSRNVESIAGTACQKKGATKTVSKVSYVCGAAPTGKTWFMVSGKLTTKGAKACKPAGKFEAAKSRVCTTVKKSNVWVKVMPLPPMIATTILGTETTVAAAGTDTTTPPQTTPSQTTIPEAASAAPKSEALREVAAALAPPELPKTDEEFVARLEPRPVEAQAAKRIPAEIKVSGGATDLASGGAFEAPLSVAILDQDGKQLPVGGNVISVTSTRPDIEMSNVVAVAGDDGVARFSDLTIAGPAGPVELSFVADFTATASFAFDLLPGAASVARLLTEFTTVTASEVFPIAPRIGLFDRHDNAVSRTGVKITATVGSTVIGTATTDGKGVAEFSGLKISEKLTTTSSVSKTIVYSYDLGAGTTSIEQTVDVVAGDPSTFEIVTMPSTTARAGLLLETQPVVRFLDKNGNPVARAGLEIFAELITSDYGASLQGTRTLKTDDSGIARFTDLSIRGGVGSYQILLASPQTGDVILSDIISLKAGVAVLINVTKTTSVFSNDVSVEKPFELEAVDEWGNRDTSFTGKLAIRPSRTVDLTVTANGSFADGALTVSSMKLVGTGGFLDLTFEAGSLSSGVQSVVLAAGVPTRIGILSRPGTVQSNATFTSPLAVQLFDSAGNASGTPNIGITLTMSGANSVVENVLTTSRGVATFVVSKLAKAGTTNVVYSRTANTSGPVLEAQSDTITVIAGTPNTVRLLTPATINERSGVVFASKPKVQVTDAAGNNIETAGIQVKGRIVVNYNSLTSTGVLSGETATTDDKGQATFNNLTVTGVATAFFVSFVPVRGGVYGGTLRVNLGAGEPAALAVVRQPNGGFNRSALRTQPTVEVRDSAGNVVAAPGITVTSTVDGATTSVQTDSTGLATFTSIVSSGLVGQRRVTFTAPGLASATSNEFELVAGPTTQIVPTRTSITGPQGIVIPNVQTRDVDGNLTTTDAFQIIASVASASGESWLLGGRISTVSGGNASFASTRISSTASSATITYTVSGRSTKISVPVTFTRELVPGNFGPTGGVIIYAAAADDDAWSRPHTEVGFSSGGRFVEVAPAGWSGSSTDPKMVWSNRVPPRSLVSYASIGFASTVTRNYSTYFKTLSPVPPLPTSAIMTVADKFAFDKDDWLLPTLGEVELMLEYAADNNSSFGLTVDSASNSTSYLTSSVDCCEYGQQFVSMAINMVPGAGSRYVFGKISDQAYVRPVRYFG